MKLRNHEKQVRKNKGVQNFASLTATVATITTGTLTTGNITTANITTDNITSAVVNSGSFGVLKIPMKSVTTTSSTSAPFWVSGAGTWFFIRVRGVVKSGHLGTG